MEARFSQIQSHIIPGTYIAMVEHSITGTNSCPDPYLIMPVVRRMLTNNVYIRKQSYGRL